MSELENNLNNSVTDNMVSAETTRSVSIQKDKINKKSPGIKGVNKKNSLAKSAIAKAKANNFYRSLILQGYPKPSNDPFLKMDHSTHHGRISSNLEAPVKSATTTRTFKDVNDSIGTDDMQSNEDVLDLPTSENEFEVDRLSNSKQLNGKGLKQWIYEKKQMEEEIKRLKRKLRGDTEGSEDEHDWDQGKKKFFKSRLITSGERQSYQKDIIDRLPFRQDDPIPVTDSFERRSFNDTTDRHPMSHANKDKYDSTNNKQNQRFQSLFKMKCPRFEGGDDDYDVWFENVKAFFRLNDYTEDEKVKIMIAQLGGEARQFISGLNETDINTMDKINALLKGAFSDQINYFEALTACKQYSGEKIRSFGLRLKILASKCKYSKEQSDETCLSILKQNSLPYFYNLLKNCMPDTTFDQALKYAIRNDKNHRSWSNKRRYEVVDQIRDHSSDSDGDDMDLDDPFSSKGRMSKRHKANDSRLIAVISQQKEELFAAKQDFKNTNKQLKDRLNTLASQVLVLNQTNRGAKPCDNARNCDFTRDERPPFDGNRRRPMVCFHCAKSGHRFTDCPNCSVEDRENIILLLKAKKFDYKSLNERAQRLINGKNLNLNLSAPLFKRQ